MRRIGRRLVLKGENESAQLKCDGEKIDFVSVVDETIFFKFEYAHCDTEKRISIITKVFFSIRLSK